MRRFAVLRALHAVGRFVGRVLEGSSQTMRNTRDSLGRPTPGSLHETLLCSLDSRRVFRGSQRVPRGDESLVTRSQKFVNSKRK